MSRWASTRTPSQAGSITGSEMSLTRRCPKACGRQARRSASTVAIIRAGRAGPVDECQARRLAASLARPGTRTPRRRRTGASRLLNGACAMTRGPAIVRPGQARRWAISTQATVQPRASRPDWPAKCHQERSPPKLRRRRRPRRQAAAAGRADDRPRLEPAGTGVLARCVRVGGGWRTASRVRSCVRPQLGGCPRTAARSAGLPPGTGVPGGPERTRVAARRVSTAGGPLPYRFGCEDAERFRRGRTPASGPVRQAR